jgi:hypothetical protein
MHSRGKLVHAEGLCAIVDTHPGGICRKRAWNGELKNYMGMFRVTGIA